MGALVDLWEWVQAKFPFEQRPTPQEKSTVVTTDDDIDFALATNIAPIRKLQPGDVLDVVIKLRRLMAQVEAASFTLYADFSTLGASDLEVEAGKARHTLELSTKRLNDLLALIEKTPAYVELRREILARRKDRDGPRPTGNE